MTSERVGELSGRLAVITDAAGGIRSGIARAFAVAEMPVARDSVD